MLVKFITTMKFMNFQSKLFTQFLLVFCTIVIYSFIAWKFSPFIPDDAYISFIYAENLAQQGELTFNIDENPVEGYSNFLWILICAWASWSEFDLVTLTPIIGWFLGVMCILLFWFIIRQRLSTIQQIAPMLILSFSGPFILYSISGMETALFSFLFLTGIICVDYIISSGHLIWFILLPVVSTLLLMCRPEGIIFFPLVVFCLLLVRLGKLGNENYSYISYKFLMISIALFLLQIFVYEIWRIEYFDEILPTALLSKGGGGKSLIFAWRTNLKFYFFNQNLFYAPLGYYYTALWGVAATTVFLYNSWKKCPIFEIIIFIVITVHTILYINFIDWMPGMRYYVPLIAPLIIVCSSLFRMVIPASKKLSLSNILNYAVAIVTILLLNFSLIAILKTDAQRGETASQKSLVMIGKWLKKNVSPKTLLAMSDIGATPYYSKLPTMDIEPESLTDITISKNGWSNDYFFHRAPGITILTSFGLSAPRFYAEHTNLYSDLRFLTEYRLIGKVRSFWNGDRSYWIFAHNSILFTDSQLSTMPKGVGY